VTLVDTNVLLDVVTDDADWAGWSRRQLDAASLREPVVVSGVVYAELAVGFERIEDWDNVLDVTGVEVAETPRDALFLAGQAFRRYRALGGPRASVLPDSFIGAHAAVARAPLLTRDVRRYRTHFPTVRLLSPYD
jgi:predicted nucleic acid-binding protein